MAKTEKSFEESIARLEEIVGALERGDVKLADSLKLFEEGTKLVTSCGKMLDEAEQQVVKLTKGADGAPVESAFTGEAEGNGR
ncbi:MAG: exodeoxyribonuclease VII small subunit [Oscillospiraceae bacterium]|nr:exodeoxyribonuclease VII small subunit [Oscillospiraceae bacterium]